MITHIQRFSVHDGPGIRTTVFLKGCQMHCPWCHNPETYRRAPEIQVFPERCIGCRACADACEHGAHEFTEAGHAYHRDRCVVCGECVDQCYAKSLVRVGETRSAESVVAEVLSDRSFYASEGGVTISGGEPLLQPEFTRDILAQCCQEGIHTAIETNLAWPWQTVLPLVPLVDLFLVDIKIIDDDAHRAWTGISNRHILENLRRLDAEGKKIVIRTPVVVGVNERPEQIDQIADFLATLRNVQQYDLLPYHPLGTGKYESLGFDEPRPEFRTPTSTELENLAHQAQRPNYVVKIAGQKKGTGSDPKEPEPAKPTSSGGACPLFREAAADSPKTASVADPKDTEPAKPTSPGGACPLFREAAADSPKTASVADPKEPEPAKPTSSGGACPLFREAAVDSAETVPAPDPKDSEPAKPTSPGGTCPLFPEAADNSPKTPSIPDQEGPDSAKPTSPPASPS